MDCFAALAMTVSIQYDAALLVPLQTLTYLDLTFHR